MKALSLCLLAALVLANVATAQLGGLYTINPIAPTGGTNYTALADAVNDLLTQGVAAPCIFEIFDDGGPYTGSMPFLSNNVGWAPSTAVLVLGQWTGASATNRVTFRAATGESPVFDASSNSMGVFWNGADYVTLEGIEIINAPMDGVTLYSETQHGQALDPVIRRCKIHDCGAGGVVIYGNSQRPQNTVVENNFFWNLQMTNAGGFNSLARFGYVSGRRHDNSRVINNTFYVTTSVGGAFAVIGDTPSGGTNSHYAEISHNIIVKTSNTARPIFSFPLIGTTGIPALTDANCFWDTSGGPFSQGQVAAANLTAWQTATGQDANSFAFDPLLASPTTGALHLRALSPCINASAVPSGVMDDIDGESRLGQVPDVGADEYGAGCATAEFQVNTNLSTVTLDSVQATQCTGAVTTLPVNGAGTAVFSSIQVGLGWEIAIAPGPLVPLSSGAFASPAGQIVNIDIAGVGVIFLFGGGIPSFTSPYPGSLTLPFTAPGLPQTSCVLMANLDPSHPDGLVLSQSCQLVVQ